MNRIQTVLGSAAIASLLMLAPLAASADTLHATSSTGVVINPNGIVRVIGAQVTSVSNGVFNAVTTIGNVVMNWVVNVSASTKLSANGSKTATTTDIKVGDKVGFTGSLASSTGSVLTVAATKVRDLTSFPLRKISEGTVSNVNTANGTFTLTHDGRTVTVATNASTTITVKGGATTTLALLAAGAKVNVAGTANTDGTVVTASRIIVQTNSKDQKDNDNDDKKDGKRGKGKSADARGIRAALNLSGGLHFGKDD